ncbi:hypothetical protein R1flu_025306 [Riccia fluitans]|uniref:Protein kinase domain-containing protein n=1 Tax=Riccia fluitans TaxID=41844 RepID=A0ABD1XXF6_9MARC
MWRSRRERIVICGKEGRWHQGLAGLVLILLLLFSASEEVVARCNGRLLLQGDTVSKQVNQTEGEQNPPPSNPPPPPPPPTNKTNGDSLRSAEAVWWIFIAVPAFFLLLLFLTILCFRFHVERRRNNSTFATKEIFPVKRLPHPWKIEMSRTMRKRIKKITITEVPLNSREELEHECEEFSNIIGSSSDSILFKGTRENGAQIAVARVQMQSSQWTASCELHFLHKVQDLARMKHPNVVSLLAYCSEDEPFERMLVFEYAPNGTVHDHLHSSGGSPADFLDWPARMKIIMGAAYGLNYMHNELDPPVTHVRFGSTCVYLTEGYSAKVAAYGMAKLSAGSNYLGRRESFGGIARTFSSEDWQVPKAENNVYSFGLFLLEMISGRCPNDDVLLIHWASEYMGINEKYWKLVDPSLPSHDSVQLAALVDIVKLCTKKSATKRPSMARVTELLACALKLTPEDASLGSSGRIDFKSSPLMWAKLEILTSEGGLSSAEEDESEAVSSSTFPLLAGGPSSPRASPRASPIVCNRSFSRVSTNSPKVGSSSGDELADSHRLDEVAINMTSTQEAA